MLNLFQSFKQWLRSKKDLQKNKLKKSLKKTTKKY